MKYINFAIVVCMAAIALFSCETFNPEDVEEVSEEVVITASVRDDSSDTKSAIDEIANNKVKFTWLAGDAINVFFGASEGSIFVTEATARVAQFKGSITGVTGGGDDLTDETSLWGVYPYDKNTTSDGSSITLTLPHSQDAKEDNLADDLYPSIARSTNFTMAFSPVCGSLRFKVTNSDIVKVTLRGNNGEDLAGKAKISMPLEGKPAVSEILEGQKELVMTAPEGGCFVPGKWYYFVLYPTGFSEGFTLTFYNESGLRGSFVREAAFPVARNMFYSAIDKDAGLTFTKIGYDYIDENGINQGPGVEIGGVMWAPVNCGYHKTDYPYGKLYQWGRKYGQGYDGSDATYPSVEAGTIKEGGVSLAEGQSETNKDAFFLSNVDNNYDWVYPSDDMLWNSDNEDSPAKNKDNDPCPDGWRVPTYNELNSLISHYSEWAQYGIKQCGYWFSGINMYTEDVPQTFFPAVGLRIYDGNALDRGSIGNYWSSTTNSNFAYFLYFDSISIKMSVSSRMLGFSVRCVKETIDSSKDNIVFADETMKEMCLAAFDTNKDSELSYAEAAAVTDLSKMSLTDKTFQSFNEFQFFTSVTSIPMEYFYDCTEMESIKIPESVNAIGQHAFYCCYSLSSIKIPQTVSFIEPCTFEGCTSLAEVDIPYAAYIGQSAFQTCTSLRSVKLPDSVQYIYHNAFYGCSELASITIPANVKEIRVQAFANCDSLTDVYMESITPPDISGGAPFPLDTNIHVPEKALESYRYSEWGTTYYYNIIIGY